MFFVLALIGWTVLPHVQRLPVWCVALTLTVLLWRGALALTAGPLPARAWVIAVLAIAVGLTLYSHRTLLGKDAGVTLLVVLLVLKTLELRARRDALVVFFLGFFIVLTNFLYSQTMLVALMMLVSVWGLLTALVLAHMPVGQPSLREAGGLALRTALYGAPLMMVLFVLFPRIGPLWGLPQDAGAKTGLSGTLRMGGVAEVASDNAVALRVRFDGPAPPLQSMYWRGPVLGAFDGSEWRRSRSATEPARAGAELATSGISVAYEMVLEPSRLPMLPLLEATPDSPESAPVLEGLHTQMRADLQWVTDRPVTERLRIKARAWRLYEHGPRAQTPALQDDLHLPFGYNPQTLAWAQQLRNEPRQRNADSLTLARAVLAHIATAGYSYTLAPGTYGDERGQHAVDEFWLDRKAGFCEHFASTFVVVMRAMGVPARLVTGYQGADAELQDGWVIVRQSHAHAWTEIWQIDRGWVRVDPTAAVAPERVQRGRALRPVPGLVAEALGNFSPELLRDFRVAWESMNHQWNQWVLNYSRGQQFNLLENLGVRSPSPEDLAYSLIGILCAASLAGAGWALWDRHRRDPWERLHERVRERLAALGVAVAPHDAPRTIAARVRNMLGDDGEVLALTLDGLDRLRYGRDGRRMPGPLWWWGFRAAARAARSSTRSAAASARAAPVA